MIFKKPPYIYSEGFHFYNPTPNPKDLFLKSGLYQVIEFTYH